MNQVEFTGYIIPKIINHFPQFAACCKSKASGVVDIEFQSPQGKLTLWLTTQDKEVTIGFDSVIQSGNDWYTHMSLFGANTPEEEADAAIRLTADILLDRVKIIYSSVLGYFIHDDDTDIDEYRQEDEAIRMYTWSEL